MPISYIAIIAIAVIAVILMIWVNKDSDQPGEAEAEAPETSSDAVTEPPQSEGPADQSAFKSSVEADHEEVQEAQEQANESAADPFKAPKS